MTADFWFGYFVGACAAILGPFLVKGFRALCKLFLRLTD